MKKYGEKLIISCLFLFSGLICLFVGWVIWIKTGDSLTTGLALVLMATSFFIRPQSHADEAEDAVRREMRTTFRATGTDEAKRAA
jgi:hypothetical protein